MDDNKKSTTIWLRPSVISRMDGWLEADNCQSRSEFVDKALRFYMGYLGTEDNTTYMLITQAAGRCGRGDEPGDVVIQTYCPEENAVKYAAEGDYEGFYRRELMIRNLAGYPPFTNIIRLGILLIKRKARREEKHRKSFFG